MNIFILATLPAHSRKNIMLCWVKRENIKDMFRKHNQQNKVL